MERLGVVEVDDIRKAVRSIQSRVDEVMGKLPWTCRSQCEGHAAMVTSFAQSAQLKKDEVGLILAVAEFLDNGLSRKISQGCAVALPPVIAAEVAKILPAIIQVSVVPLIEASVEKNMKDMRERHRKKDVYTINGKEYSRTLINGILAFVYRTIVLTVIVYILLIMLGKAPCITLEKGRLEVKPRVGHMVWTNDNKAVGG